MHDITKLKKTIELFWDHKDSIGNLSKLELDQQTATVKEILELLDQGILRISEKIDGVWQVHEWLKKTILLAFRLFPNQLINNGYDKIPLKFTSWEKENFNNAQIRVVPGTIVRYGSHIAKNTILMPSFINIGAFIDEKTMIDSGVTVGSCAQIGKRCHISANAIIGGVLEPLQNNPVIIEDDCFIGMGAMVAEGTIVEQGAVLSIGVNIGASSKIIDLKSNQIFYGRVPAYSVVVPGNYVTSNNQVSLNCAVIIKTVDEKTRSKTAINELLRM